MKIVFTEEEQSQLKFVLHKGQCLDVGKKNLRPLWIFLNIF